MGRITWVCATCTEHFTRKYSASRHNKNLHFGNGQIVRLLDYIVGRASGLYLPSDPRTSKNHNPFIHDYTSKQQSKPVSQGIASNNRPYPAANSNTTNMYENSHLFHFHYPTPNPISNANDKPPDKVQDRIRKYEELRTFVRKYYTVEGAEKTLKVASWYLTHGDGRLIDEQLAKFRKLEGRL
jgi:hypothetical protein